MNKKSVFFSSNLNYDTIDDEKIVDFVKSGDKCALEYLINKYRNLVNLKVNRYFIIGAEREDIVQEGLIGLFKAIKNYQTNKQSSFKNFANMCIERQLITAIKSSNRQKHMPLNSYLSLNMNAYDNNDINDKNEADLIEILNTNLIEDPLDTITQKEYYKIIENAIDKYLSSFEKQVLNFYVQGQSYGQIAEKLNTPVKSVDNAIQRIRKKATKEIPNEQF